MPYLAEGDKIINCIDFSDGLFKYFIKMFVFLLKIIFEYNFLKVRGEMISELTTANGDSLLVYE